MKAVTLALATSLFAAASAEAGRPNEPAPRACIPACQIGTNKKLNGIIIPKVDFRNVTVSEAIEFLRQKSQQLDPEGFGVNIVLKLPAEAMPQLAPQPAAGSKRP